MVQGILSIFIESKVGTSRSDMENARAFLDQQLALYERQLREAEARRAEFRSKYVDLLPSDAGVSRLEAARGQVQLLQGQLTDALNKRDMMRREMAAVPAVLTMESDMPVILPGGFGAAAAPGQLAQAEAKLAELRLRYTEQHPEVIDPNVPRPPSPVAWRPSARQCCGRSCQSATWISPLYRYRCSCCAQRCQAGCGLPSLHERNTRSE